MQYQERGGPHEHKGPGDFNDRRDGDDDDDDDIGTPPADDQLPPDHVIPQLQGTPSFQHVKHVPSPSPPIANGITPFIHRQHTPQPPMDSRPNSRNDVRRPKSNLISQHQQHVSLPPQPPNGYTYMPTPSMYHPHAPHGIQGGPHPTQPLQSQSHPGQTPAQMPYQYSHHQSPPQHAQVQQAFLQDQRRQSMPPAFPQQERVHQATQIQAQSGQSPSPPQPQHVHNTNGLQPEQPKPMPVKSRSIFTPIDDSRSLLAQHWGFGTTTEPRTEAVKSEKDNRSQSVDVSSIQRHYSSVPTPPPPPPRPAPQPQRTQTISSLAGEGGKRPRLKVQIPSEQSDDGGSATAASSPGETADGTPAKASSGASHSSAVVLPPPSPSASTLLSAGAQGPPNPFARPHPPMNTGNQNNQAYNSNNNIETPISALPSRFVADGLLPSPSSFYPEWGFGRSGDSSNMLPSPLNFQTPVGVNGPSFLRDEEDRKRKSPESDAQLEAGAAKKMKT